MSTLICNSTSFADVQDRVTQAVDGDTVIIPVGLSSWTTGLSITQSITLQGQTTVDSSAGTFNDQTVIVDNVSTDFPCIAMSPGDGKTVRVSGITFRGGSGVTAGRINGAVTIGGSLGSTGAQVRLSGCHFDGIIRTDCIFVGGATYGVVDHNVLNSGNFSTQSWLVRLPNWGGNTEGQGDGSYADFPWFGTNKFIFFEDNYLSNTTTNPIALCSDGDFGARFVIRHNKGFNYQIQNHGTESPYRGTRCAEIYSNELHFSGTPTGLGGVRTGAYLYHDNNFIGTHGHGLDLTDLRFNFAFAGVQGSRADVAGFGGATGANSWDVNAGADGVTPVAAGQPGFLFFSGTAAAGSNTTTIVDSGSPGWTPNVFQGYSVKRVSDGGMSMILSNTANTLNVSFASGGYGSSPNWSAGNQYEIRKALITIDQPGRGKCDALVGGYNSNQNSATSLTIGIGTKTLTVFASPANTGKPVVLISQANNSNTMSGTVTSYNGTTMVVNVTSVTGSGTDNSWNVVTKYDSLTGTTQWPNQALEPCYAWGNQYNGVLDSGFDFSVSSSFLPAGTILQDQRDFYNASSSSAVVAKYTAALNGVQYGGTFQYPHPLVSGAVSQPPAITSPLTATAVVGVPFSYQITATNVPTSFGATPLPSGLSINTSTGLISGTITVYLLQVPTSINLSATNSSGTGTAVLVLTVNQAQPQPPVINSPLGVSGVVGQFLSYQITATNNPNSYAAKSLPSGLAVNSGTGLITGTPSGAAVTVSTVSATNGAGTGTADVTFTITASSPSQVFKHPRKWKNLVTRRRV